MLCTANGKDIIDNQRDGCPLKLFGPNADAPHASAPPKPIQPVARQDWPAWANFIASHADPTDAGVGDTIHRRLGKAGEWTKAALKAAGVPCGCDARRERWNHLYPYHRETVDRVE